MERIGQVITSMVWKREYETFLANVFGYGSK